MENVKEKNNILGGQSLKKNLAEIMPLVEFFLFWQIKFQQE